MRYTVNSSYSKSKGPELFIRITEFRYEGIYISVIKAVGEIITSI